MRPERYRSEFGPFGVPNEAPAWAAKVGGQETLIFALPVRVYSTMIGQQTLRRAELVV